MSVDYDNRSEHTHGRAAQPLTWALLVAVLILAGMVTVLASYLIGRVALSDRRQHATQVSICAVLNAIPPGNAHEPPRERRAFSEAYRLEECHRLLAPSPTPSPQVTSSSNPAATIQPPNTVATSPTKGATSPTKRHHVAPTPRPSHTPKPRPTPPRPTPTPTSTCVLFVCLKGQL